MSQSNPGVLEPRLVAVDSHLLSVVDNYIQDYSNECESLAYALNAIETNDPMSHGVIVAIRSALLSISEHSSNLSGSILEQLILMPELEINPYEQQSKTWGEQPLESCDKVEEK